MRIAEATGVSNMAFDLQRLLRLIECGPAVIFRRDAAPGWPIQSVSANVRRWGLDAAALVRERVPYETLIEPEDRERVAAELDRRVRQGADEYSMEYRLRGGDGRVRWIEEHGVLVRNDSGRVEAHEGMMLDVTARVLAERRLTEQNAEIAHQVEERTSTLQKMNEMLQEEVRLRRRMEEEWRETAARFQAMVECFDGYVYICSADYRIEFMNSRLAEWSGGVAVGQPCYAVLHGREGVCPWCVNERVLKGETVRWEVQSPKDGRWYYVVNVPFRHADGRMAKMAMIQDITERKLAELALQESEQRYRRLLASVTDYVYIVELREGQPVSTHHGPGCEAVTGYRPEEFHERPMLWLEMVHPEDRELVVQHARAILRGEEPRPLEHRIIRKDGAVRWVRNTPSLRRDAEGRLTGYDGLVKDITEQRLAEEERLRLEREKNEAQQRAALERANRLASLGLLAAGVAHEVNNPLQGMLSHLEAIRRDLPPDFPRLKSLAMVERGIEAIRGLVQRLLWLAAGHDEGIEATRFSEAVEFVRELLQGPLRKAGVRLEVELRSPDVHLAISRGELIQILLNLVTNARDAMPNGGKVVITCTQAGGRGVITVADTGTGIPAHIQPKLFTPFFTTKGAKGAGLGLSIVHSIVHAHAGQITFDTEVGRGTTFRIELPLAEVGR